MSSLPTGPVAPQTLCRHVLTALRQRVQGDHELSYLEMLLTYFVDLDPTPADFTARLQRYVADGRPGIADAATTLLETWQRSQQAAQPLTLPLPELLRTLGAVIALEPAEVVACELRPEGVEIRQFGLTHAERLDLLALQQQSTARRALRGQVPGAPPASALPHESLLRLIGLDLETQPAQAYTLLITAQAVTVLGAAGYHAVFPVEQLAARARTASQRRARPPRR
jgi:hypothetical protein